MSKMCKFYCQFGQIFVIFGLFSHIEVALAIVKCESRYQISLERVKNANLDLLSKIKKLELPNLDSFLTSKSFDSIFKCKLCEFSSIKKNALNAHMSKHKDDSK
jgi:hypothetical protein